MKMKTLPLLLAACIGLTGLNAQAGETRFEQFYQQHDSAYASYRVALFQTNKQDEKGSLKGISGFNQKWSKLIVQFADNPPEIFASDAEWKQTLVNVADLAEKSDNEIKAGQFTQAHETLEGIRDELSHLRSRNHLVFFSDHINAYHQAMEHLLLAGYNETNIDNQSVPAIREQLAVLEYLVKMIADNAPQDYKTNKEYNALQQGLVDSLAQLRNALVNGDANAVDKAIKALKPAYAKLFVKFG